MQHRSNLSNNLIKSQEGEIFPYFHKEKYTRDCNLPSNVMKRSCNKYDCL